MIENQKKKTLGNIRQVLLFITTTFVIPIGGASPTHASDRDPSISSKYRGWDFLVSQLQERGVPENTLKQIYLDPNMPPFLRLEFSVNPSESKRIYRHFLEPSRIQAAQKYMQEHRTWFSLAQQKYGLPEEIIGSIILVETHIGGYTGNHSVIYRLSRLANAASPENIRKNYARLLNSGEKVTLQEVEDRGRYLLDLFIPEIEATIHIAEQQRFSVFKMKGSPAGAFGIPQFLPTSFLRYGVDANEDGKTSLFDHSDAILSIANYLTSNMRATDPNANMQSLSAIEKGIWKYNNSQAYVDTVISVAKALGL
ncbi:MAG: lytic murein transglycosylase, partial [Bdellovibrionales bacterium]|nr:lytic murein transglycosylase [Bdellovibrionales bacterium]